MSEKETILVWVGVAAIAGAFYWYNHQKKADLAARQNPIALSNPNQSDLASTALGAALRYGGDFLEKFANQTSGYPDEG